jgi:hypothetical protein
MTRALLLLPLTGCIFIFEKPDDTTTPTGDTGPVDDWQLQSYVDVGDVCFQAGAEGVEVLVTVQECLSSSCSRDLVATCAATVDGSAITLTSDISWEQNVGAGVPCTEDCGTPLATCTVAGLADGTYQVTHGADVLELTVPIADTQACSMYL